VPGAQLEPRGSNPSAERQQGDSRVNHRSGGPGCPSDVPRARLDDQGSGLRTSKFEAGRAVPE
jgi:hypothetical protein